MSTRRLFVAIELPEAIRSALTGAIASVADEPVRWVRAESMHLTVRFLGDVEEDRLSEVEAAISASASACPRFELSIEGGGHFPLRGAPRVLWSGVEGDLESLRALERALGEHLARAEFARDRRGYHPHVTLGRVKRGNPRRAVEVLGSLGVIGRVSVENLTLFHSELLPTGAAHTALVRAPLAR